MKVTVITGPRGRIVGTMRHSKESPGTPTVRIVAGAGQKAHELDLPDNLAKGGSADEFHKAIKKHLSK
ncbi:MAG TPA: hypothetical protein VG425_01930 [Casimicrobiaceae bacterium]|jgi:hypothetical protein|nr:hypothetical protein [Casimicrobiaceae bacterium]